MRNVLIVSPHFPPINAPDMQRVRLSLPHLERFGWRPVVLSVDPDAVEGVRDPLLEETLPPELAVTRAAALPTGLTRPLGLGNLGLRAFPQLYRRGLRLIEERKIDLVYFSTTVFTVMPLGRLWERRCGVPFVIDMQDPWVNDWSEADGGPRPVNSRLAGWMHARLEPWTMSRVSGLVSVSEQYLRTLRNRYPRLGALPMETLPFGYAERDFELLQRRPQPNRFFARGNGLLHGVYVGRGGADMRTALEAMLGALRKGLREDPQRFERIRLHFVGTDYAPAPWGRPTVQPLAEGMGLGDRVRESVQRVPYFEALQLLADGDFLLVPGSQDPSYSASKIYPYVLARKPLLAVFHERSSVVDFVRRTGCGRVVAFRSRQPGAELIDEVYGEWKRILSQPGKAPELRWDQLEPHGAREMTRRQCRLFDRVVAGEAA